MTNPALLRLLQLTSPALPIGAYAYSQGLEHAVHAGWVRDEETAGAWILGLLEDTLPCLEVPVLLRLHTAWQGAGDVEVHGGPVPVVAAGCLCAREGRRAGFLHQQVKGRLEAQQLGGVGTEAPPDRQLEGPGVEARPALEVVHVEVDEQPGHGRGSSIR